MKKLFALLMAIMLALPCLAGAEGLGGLGGGDSAGGGGLIGLMPTEAPNLNLGVVPDAADFTATAKTVLQKNYEYVTGLFFTAYTYAMPNDVAAFTEAYTAEAEKNGFTVEQTTVEGYDARQITWTDGTYALLVPNFGGQVLLLVQNGMTFGKPKPTGYYIEFEYNGESMQQSYSSYTQGSIYEYNYTSSPDQFHFSAAASAFDASYPIDYFSIDFPTSVKAGTTYSPRSKSDYFDLTVARNKNYTWLLTDNSIPNEIKESDDYFTFTVISVETITDRIEIEAEFEGRFRYGAITITNGHFYLAFRRK